MFKIKAPDQFKAVPWKNGLGVTHELAINPGGTLEQFDWRLSMATVNQDGYFSDFSGYHRNLILLQGNGIELTHDKKHCDRLKNKLSHASFNGQCQTYGKLIDGPIVDFNVITKVNTIKPKIETYTEQTQLPLAAIKLGFIYATGESLTINAHNQNHVLPQGHLIELNDLSPKQIMVSGNDFILIDLSVVS